MFICAECRNGKWYALYVKKGRFYPKVKYSMEFPNENKEFRILTYERKANASKTCNFYNDSRDTKFKPKKVRKKNEEH